MLARLLRTHLHPFRTLGNPALSWRHFHNVPFQDDLTPADEDFLNLGDFQHYQEAPDVKAHRQKLGLEDPDLDVLDTPQKRPHSKNLTENHPKENIITSATDGATQNFQDACVAEEPVVFVSRLTDPYLNLAIEDYIYTKMPLPASKASCNRLMFYVNSPCVVVGKNQNPWREVNIPLLTNLRLPLVRRRSGGGTVVHDLGNVNYSFMAPKEDFDRFTFARLVVDAVNTENDRVKPPHLDATKVDHNDSKHGDLGGNSPPGHSRIAVNERGDIVTEETNQKVSGSAYKLSRGKSYHHGTMLLDSKLEVLRKLLHRDETKLGEVFSVAAVASVKSPVENIHMDKDAFISAVTDAFKQEYGRVAEKKKVEGHDQDSGLSDFDQTELLGLQGFVDAYSARECRVFTIDENTDLPEEIASVQQELAQWEWKYGATPKFSHRFRHPTRDFSVTIEVEKKGLVSGVNIEGGSDKEADAFQFLRSVLERGDSVQYTGSNVAGFIVDDEISEWIGHAIDGTS